TLVEVRVTQRAVDELLDEEERPAFADEVESVGQRAVLGVALGHGLRFYTTCLQIQILNLQYESVSCSLPHSSYRKRDDPERGDRMVVSERKKWFALALLCVTQFVVVLDIAIVNVALPSIQTDLHFTQENLQWVISAYALV